MSTKRDYYDILGVSKTASASELKSAYRKLALQWHPDRNKSPEAETKFKEINEAYQVLSDPKKKATYDQFGHVAFDPAAGGAGGNPYAGGFGSGQGPFTYYYSSGNNPFGDLGGFSDPFEIFEQFFGGGNPFGRTTKRKPHYSLRIPFMTAVKGGSEEVDINGKKHTIKIPAGSDTGTHLRFTDFDITFEVESHPHFRRDGADLFIDHNIPFTQAILGGETTVTTLDGEFKLKIRPGTQSGTMMRLRERGVPHLRGRGKGDEYVRINVVTPEKLTREQRKIIEEMKEEGL